MYLQKYAKVLYSCFTGAVAFIKVTRVNKGILKVNYKVLLNCKKHNSSRCDIILYYIII